MESFEEMLEDFYNQKDLQINYESLKIPDPKLNSNIWINAKTFLKKINRHPDHFINYLVKKTEGNASWVSNSKSDGIIFLKRININMIGKYMKEYIKDYVQCKQCLKCFTYLEKDKSLNKFKICCSIPTCKATRYC